MALKLEITRDEALAEGAKTYFTGKPCKHGQSGLLQITHVFYVIVPTGKQCTQKTLPKLETVEKHITGMIQRGSCKNQRMVS